LQDYVVSLIYLLLFCRIYGFVTKIFYRAQCQSVSEIKANKVRQQICSKSIKNRRSGDCAESD